MTTENDTDAWDRLFVNAKVATMTDGTGAYGLIEDGAVALAGDTVAWVGPRADLPGTDLQGTDCGGAVLTPGLVDCHTHLVYGGNRAAEFEERLNGVSYEEISRRGGGIASTVAATRSESEAELIASGAKRLDRLRAEGVTTVEIKSGYGLDTETELKMLRAARALGETDGVDVVTSFLGAHAIPPEYKGRSSEFIDLVCEEMLPAAADAGLADAVDGFCENIAFTPDEIERVFQKADKLGLPVKLHAEQLSDLGGAALAARYGALSSDHLEYLSQPGVDAMAEAGSVAVLLPGAFYYLHETRKPPVEALVAAGVPIAVATDLNPGSSPVNSLLSAMNMACVLFGLTPEQVVRGATANAARALGLEDRGTIEPGKKADLAFWDVTGPGELAYPLGANPCLAAYKSGRRIDGIGRGFTEGQA